MISYLNGKYVGLVSGRVIIDCHGVGYGVWVADKVKSQFKSEDVIKLFVYTHVREDALELFGFVKKEELELFLLLLTVSGIGPKSALLIIERGAEAIKKAILMADVGFFTTIPRIGKKNAQKIIIELKQKLGSLEELDLTKEDEETQEVLSALQSVGFSKQEAVTAIKKLPSELVTTEEKLRFALKNMKYETK